MGTSLEEEDKDNVCTPVYDEEVFNRALLRQLRKANELTQEGLAEALRVKANTVFNWEKGIYKPSFENVSRIANYFGVEVNKFYKSGGGKRTVGARSNYDRQTSAQSAQMECETKTYKLLQQLSDYINDLNSYPHVFNETDYKNVLQKSQQLKKTLLETAHNTFLHKNKSDRNKEEDMASV